MRLPVLGLILAIGVWPHPAGRRPQQASGLSDSLRALAFQMVDLLRARDVVGALALYGDTTHFTHIEDGEIVPWTRLSAMMRAYLASVNSNPLFVVGEPGVVIADRNNAVLYVTHRFDGASGQPAHVGVWTGVLHRFPSGWRIVHSHSSSRAGP